VLTFSGLVAGALVAAFAAEPFIHRTAWSSAFVGLAVLILCLYRDLLHTMERSRREQMLEFARIAISGIQVDYKAHQDLDLDDVPMSERIDLEWQRWRGQS